MGVKDYGSLACDIEGIVAQVLTRRDGGTEGGEKNHAMIRG
jgi:hypothetical protein